MGAGCGDDDVAALLPVGGGGDPVFRGELHGVEDAEDLVEVAAGGHGIAELQLDLLVGADDEDGADGGVGGRGAAFAAAGLGGRGPGVGPGDLDVDIADHGVVDGVAGDVLNVDGPPCVVLDGIDREADDLGSALGELAFEAGHGAEFGGADGGGVLGVGGEGGAVRPAPV